jgi:hypothetical protein
MTDFDADDPAEMARARQQTVEHNQQWIARWPNHCKKCGGWGIFAYLESHGDRFSPAEHLVDPCGELPETFCHRCGMEGFDADHERACFFCGHYDDDGLIEEGY